MRFFFFFIISLNATNLPVSDILVVPHKFYMMYFYFYSIQNIKIFFLPFPLWSVCYFQVCCLFSKCLGFSIHLFVIDLEFNPIMIWEHTSYNFYFSKFVKVCFIPQNIVYCSEYFMCTWEKSLLCSCWVGCSTNVS